MEEAQHQHLERLVLWQLLVDWELLENALHCTVSVTAHYKTGIEMEAITGVCAGLLCALDMVKSHEKDADGQYPNSEICQVRIVEKYKSE